MRSPEVWESRWPTHGDRKSTRLNSSHLVISYAVFCLKKKKYTDGRVTSGHDEEGGCSGTRLDDRSALRRPHRRSAATCQALPRPCCSCLATAIRDPAR